MDYTKVPQPMERGEKLGLILVLKYVRVSFAPSLVYARIEKRIREYLCYVLSKSGKLHNDSKR